MSKFLCDHDLHTHTILSSCCHDEGMTPDAVFAHAAKCGYAAQCLTDHLWDASVPGASKWYAPQDIAHIRQSLPLPQGGATKRYFGCETEYCGGDKIGLRPDHFDEFSFVIIPPNHFHMVDFVRPAAIDTPEGVARLLIERLEELSRLPLPFRKIGIAHLTTSLLMRGGDKLEVVDQIPEERFFDVMRFYAKAGAGIELNGSCFREGWRNNADTELKLYRIAKQAGCAFYLGTDAHALRALDRIQTDLPAVVEALELTIADRYEIPE